eukprot:gene10545-10705_t
MLLASSGFVTICPKKELDLHTADHRADHAAELKAEISWDAKGATGNEYAFLPGGAVRAINPNSSMTLAQQAECIAVFKGNLSNKAELAMQLVGCPPHLSEAQLLLQLYAAYGLDMLPRLHGKFAFCLYDSKQARVFAARDHSGEIPLLEGRTAAGSLIIACGTFMPEGVTQLVDIGPGEYKYGWHALPRTFHCGARIVTGRASCDYGIRRRSIDAYNTPARSPMNRSISLDIPKHMSGNSSHPTTPTSQSMTHTPGRYMPPHLAAAFAGGAAPGAAGQYIGRSRSASYDGHNFHAGPPPAASTGRRRTSQCTQQEAVTPTAAAEDATATPRTAEHHRRKRRHHRRNRNKDKDASVDKDAAAAAAQDEHISDSESLVSSGTLDSTSSGALAVAATAAGPGTGSGSAPSSPKNAAATTPGKQAGGSKSGKSNASSGAAAAATASKAAVRGQRHQHSGKQAAQPLHLATAQRRSSGGGVGGSGGGSFKRTGSCGELAVLGTSPTAAHAALLAGPQPGLAC